MSRSALARSYACEMRRAVLRASEMDRAAPLRSPAFVCGSHSGRLSRVAQLRGPKPLTPFRREPKSDQLPAGITDHFGPESAVSTTGAGRETGIECRFLDCRGNEGLNPARLMDRFGGRASLAGKAGRLHHQPPGPLPNAGAGEYRAPFWSTTIRFSGPVASPGIVTEVRAANDAPKCALMATAGLIHALSTAPRA